jgi:hypothetical protein
VKNKKDFIEKKNFFFIIDFSTSSWIQPKPKSISKSCKRSLTIRSWIRNNTSLVFFWSLYSFICLCICTHVFRIYIGQQHAHFLVIIARINGKHKCLFSF